MKKPVMNLIPGLMILFGSFGAGAEPSTVPSVDLNRYVGTWYEVASIPQYFQRKCVRNTAAEYSLAQDGMIKVVNSCETESGERTVAEGRAQVVDALSNSKLKVTFVKFFGWIFAFGGNYWILDLSPDYNYAVVGDPTLKYLWILSREPSLNFSTYVAIEKNLKEIGYDTCLILTSLQTAGISQRQPLCEFVKTAR